MRARSTVAGIALLVFATGVVRGADDFPTQMAQRGALLFADDFDRDEPGEKWELSAKSFSIRDGALFGGTLPEKSHPAIAKVPLPFKDIVLRFAFRFEGSTSLSVVFNDKQYTGSHAGHLCRASINARSISITDDKTGLMSAEHYAKKSDPARKAEADTVQERTSVSAPFKMEQGRWYTMTLELLGDEMVVSIDDKPRVLFKSPGLDHATKTSFHYTVGGRSMAFDKIQVWKALPDAAWAERRETLTKTLTLTPGRNTRSDSSE